jgi:hypothetical protein
MAARMSSLLLTGLSAILFLSTVTAAAQTYFVAPTPSGSDRNDCLGPSTACATFQRAVDLCPRTCQILPAPGVYSQKTNVFYYKVISISGPLNEDGNCIDRSAVVVDDRINDRGQAALFWVQDHAILTISCMTLAAYANGSVGFALRQFAIGDINHVNFGQFRGSHAVMANEESKGNILSPGIYGDAIRFATASDLSQVHLGGTIRVADGLTFEVAFVSAVSNSLILFRPSKVMGGEAMSGASYQCNDATIKTSVILPGGDTPYVGNSNCTFNTIHTEIDTKLSPEIKAIRSEMDGKLSPEIKAIRSHIDEQLSPEIKAIYKLLHNFIIAVLVVLAVAAALSAFYVWHQHRRWRLYQPGNLPITPVNQTRATNSPE